MKKTQIDIIVGLFVLCGLIMIAYMTLSLGRVSLFGGDTYTLYGRFNSVSGLRAGNPVKMLGMEIGRVGKLSLDQDDLKAVVEIKIKKGVKIYDDAIATVKVEGLIGDHYLSIDPGGGGNLLAAGENIIETHGSLDIYDLIGKYAFGDVGNDP